MDYIQEYKRWCELAKGDADVEKELSDIAADEAKIEDAFYRNLAFGTGGLRGVIGAGTNRMNIHVVAKASQGLADYIVKSFPEKDRKIAVSYDSRIKSDLFSKVAAGVFAANGIKVYIYSELMPTPCLSYAVRALHCAAGIMVTASHNPSEYNGYKVYGADGCQITTEAAKTILAEIAQLLMLCWDSRGINHQAMFLVLTCMRNQIHVFLIMNQGALLLQTTGQIRRCFIITCYNQATMNEITYQCTHTYTTGTNEIYSFYILCFHFLILLCSCEF